MKKYIIFPILIASVLFIASCTQTQKLECQDECSSDSCNGFNYNSCIVQEDGCKDKIDEGIIKGKCGIDCLSNQDCNTDEECNSNYKCETRSSPKIPPPPTTPILQDKCGNGQIDSTENCGNCPTDIVCDNSRKYSCIDNECIKVEKINFEYQPKTGFYCGYTSKDSKSDNIALEATQFTETCQLASNSDSGAKKLVDNKFYKINDHWSCSTPTLDALRMPQKAAFKLKEKSLINKIILVQNSGKDDKRNAKKFIIESSVDSTNGLDGHWVTLTTGKLKNQHGASFEKNFLPITSLWIRVTVSSLWDYQTNMFSLAELKVFEARLECVSNPN